MIQILVVDDSLFARNYHINVLKINGYSAEGAADGAEALEKTLEKEYDLILCDINMANMDGITFIRKFRSFGKETPIIIITTQEEATHRKIGIEAGANVYIIKPVKPEELLINVKMLLGR